MPWFLVDDAFPSHPKVLATSLPARGLWVTAGSWSSARLTDGAVPDHVLASLGGTPELAAELVTNGLWRRVRGGYKFTGVTEKIPLRTAVDNDRKAAAERQRRSREARRSRRDSRVTHTSVTMPDPGTDPGLMADVVNRPNGTSARASPETIDSIMKEILNVTGRHITPDWAARIAADLLKGRATASPAAYVRQAIRNDPNPRQRFLPLY